MDDDTLGVGLPTDDVDAGTDTELEIPELDTPDIADEPEEEDTY